MQRKFFIVVFITIFGLFLNNCGDGGGGGENDIGSTTETAPGTDGTGSRAVYNLASSNGKNHSCAIHNGVLKCWGKNEFGQLGNRTSGAGVYSATPVEVLNVLANGMDTEIFSDVTAISLGEDHTCAIQNGAAKCWGSNRYGQMGYGGATGVGAWVSFPRQVVGLDSGVSAISSGENHSCAIHNGVLKCWGNNRYGQLGNVNSGVGVFSTTPVQVKNVLDIERRRVEEDSFLGVTALSLGSNHTCAIQNGVAKCWGSNSVGQLGGGTETGTGENGYVSYPKQVDGLDSSVTAISAGAMHTCAIHNGVLKCWGKNEFGQLGNRTSGAGSYSATPVEVLNVLANGMDTEIFSDVTAISLGEDHTCAIQNGAAKCWGSNRYGQMGYGGATGVGAWLSFPRQVVGLDSGVTAISAGAMHSCAIHNGVLKCWGKNEFGQLGDGTSGAAVIRSIPISIIDFK